MVETFSNYNFVVSTRDPAEYVGKVKRMSTAADENGFSDTGLIIYQYLTGKTPVS